jgi:hypothetical protein
MNIRKVERRIIDVRRPTMGGIRKMSFEDILKASWKKYFSKYIKRVSAESDEWDLEWISTADTSLSGGKRGRNHDVETKFINKLDNDPNKMYSFTSNTPEKIRNPEAMVMSKIRNALRGEEEGNSGINLIGSGHRARKRREEEE